MSIRCHLPLEEQLGWADAYIASLERQLNTLKDHCAHLEKENHHLACANVLTDQTCQQLREANQDLWHKYYAALKENNNLIKRINNGNRR